MFKIEIEVGMERLGLSMTPPETDTLWRALNGWIVLSDIPFVVPPPLVAPVPASSSPSFGGGTSASSATQPPPPSVVLTLSLLDVGFEDEGGAPLVDLGCLVKAMNLEQALAEAGFLSGGGSSGDSSAKEDDVYAVILAALLQDLRDDGNEDAVARAAAVSASASLSASKATLPEDPSSLGREKKVDADEAVAVVVLLLGKCYPQFSSVVGSTSDGGEGGGGEGGSGGGDEATTVVAEADDAWASIPPELALVVAQSSSSGDNGPQSLTAMDEKERGVARAWGRKLLKARLQMGGGGGRAASSLPAKLHAALEKGPTGNTAAASGSGGGASSRKKEQTQHQESVLVPSVQQVSRFLALYDARAVAAQVVAMVGLAPFALIMKRRQRQKRQDQQQEEGDSPWKHALDVIAASAEQLIHEAVAAAVGGGDCVHRVFAQTEWGQVINGD